MAIKKNLSFIACAFYLPSLKKPFWDGKAQNTTLDLNTHTSLSHPTNLDIEVYWITFFTSHADQLCDCVVQVWITEPKNLNTNDPQSLKW